MRHESYSTTLPVLFLFLPQFTERILIDNIQSQILKDEIFDSVAFFQDLEKISELIQVLDSNGYKNIIPAETIEKLIAYLCLLYYAYNSTNEKVENHYDEQVESYYDEQVEYCYDEQVESYYDEQAKTKVFPKINIKKNIKNNIQRLSLIHISEPTRR